VTIDGTNGITTPMYSGAISANAVTPVNSFKNRIINGNMSVDQRNAGASVTAVDGTYTLDRWQTYSTPASKFSVQQNAGSVTPPVGFKNYLGATSLSAYSVTSNDYFTVGQAIEGFNVADLEFGTANAKTITISFWVRSSLTGTFGAGVTNSAFNRSFPFSYTINSANTWEQKSVTIAGDTSGTWLTNNGRGLELDFGIGVGSTNSGTAGSWQSGWKPSVTGATNIVGTNGATFYITGVQLEVGSTATSFDYRPYGTELALCQRYFFNVGGQIYSTASSGGTAYLTTWCFGLVKSPVTMRAMPTFTKTGNWNWNDYNAVNTNTGALTFRSTSSTLDAFWIASEGTSSGLTALQAYFLTAANDATARLSFSAEL
ncbi:hypothetical protein UFOVP678_59, partial [uncultured Caudovirales phage]